MAFSAGTAFVTVLPNTSSFAPALYASLGGMAGGSTGSKLNQLGSKLTRNVTVPIAAIGAASIKSAIDFESAFAGVRKTVDATEKQFARLEKGMRNLAKETGVPFEEIAKVGEAAGQLGIARNRILDFTKTMVDLGNTTDLTSDQAATAIARMANIMKTPQTEFDRMGSTIVDLGNKFAATESEITEMALRLAGAGEQIDLTEAQVLALATGLSSVGIKAEAGGSAFSRVMIDLANAAAKGGDELEGFAEVAGMSGDAFGELFQRDSADALIRFVEGLGRVKREGGNVFQVLEDLGITEIRMRDALLRTAGAGDLLRESIKTGNEAWRENTALTEEANKRYDTAEYRIKQVWARLRDAASVIGESLVPVLERVIEPLGAAADVFGNLPAPIRSTVLAFGALAAASGPLVKGLDKVTGGAASTSTALKGLGAIGAGLVARDVLIGLSNQLDEVAESGDGLVNALARGGSNIADLYAQGPIKAVYDRLKEVGDAAEDVEKKHNDLVKSFQKGEISASELSKGFRKLGIDAENATIAIDASGDVVGSTLERAREFATGMDRVSRTTNRAGKDIVGFAGLTSDELDTWSTEVRDSMDPVGDILQELASEAKVTTREVVRTFARQARAWANYEENLAALERSNIPDEIVQHLAEMGVEGARIVEALAGATKKDGKRLEGYLKDIGFSAKDLRQIFGIEIGEKTPDEIKKGVEKGKGHLDKGFGDMLAKTRAFTSAFGGAINEVREAVGLDALSIGVGAGGNIVGNVLGGVTRDVRQHHEGGIVGRDGKPHRGPLKKNERVIVAEEGEEVIPKKDVGGGRSVQEARRKSRQQTGDWGTLLELLYPANDPNHKDHLHYALSTSADVIRMGLYLRSKGYTVAEGPGPLGPIGGGHSPTGYHPLGLAADVNTAAGQSTAEMAALNQLAEWIRAATSGGAGAVPMGGDGAYLDPRALETGAVKNVPVPLFPGRLRPVGPREMQNLTKALYGRAQSWVGTSGYTGGGNVSEWARAGLALAGAPASWHGMMMQRIMAESGGNPTIRNTSAGLSGGIPSGLTQIVVPGTWNAYARPGWDWQNPIQNVATSAIYSRARYGGFGPISPYHTGGQLPEDVFGVDRRGRRYHLQGGETVTERGGSFVARFKGPVKVDLVNGEMYVDAVILENEKYQNRRARAAVRG